MGECPEVDDEDVEGGEGTGDGDPAIEEGEGGVSALRDLAAHDGVRQGDGIDCDEDAEGEGKDGKAGGDAGVDHAACFREGGGVGMGLGCVTDLDKDSGKRGGVLAWPHPTAY